MKAFYTFRIIPARRIRLYDFYFYRSSGLSNISNAVVDIFK